MNEQRARAKVKYSCKTPLLHLSFLPACFILLMILVCGDLSQQLKKKGENTILWLCL